MVEPQKAVRWEPASGIPEGPCYDFALESPEMGKLRLLLKYSLIRGNPNRDLSLNFSDVRAYRSYWDGDGIEDLGEIPRCLGSNWPWPLLMIENSHWVASEDFAVSKWIAEANREEVWRHFSVLTLERHLDILTRGEISAEWVSGHRPDSTVGE